MRIKSNKADVLVYKFLKKFYDFKNNYIFGNKISFTI